MRQIIDCWAAAEKRAKHLCALETLGLSGGKWRCRRPQKDDVKKAWHQLCLRLHPDKHSDGELATEATRCLNLAKKYLFEEHFADAASRVNHKHDAEAQKKAKESIEAAKEREKIAAAAAEAQANAAAAETEAQPEPEVEPADKQQQQQQHEEQQSQDADDADKELEVNKRQRVQ